MNHFKPNKIFFIDAYSIYEYSFINGFMRNIKNINKNLNPLEAHNNINESCKYTINAIAKRKGWSYDKTKNFLLTLNSIYPKSLKDILYKVISLETNKNKEVTQYIYVITISSNKKSIVLPLKDTGKQTVLVNSNEYAIFYTPEDAEWAIKVVEKILEVFNGK